MSAIAEPRILLRFFIEPALADARHAIETHYRSDITAEFRAGGLRVSYENALAILTATRAVEIYKKSADRKDEKHRYRLSQRTALRRVQSPLSRAPRLPYEWDGSARIPALNAEELSTRHADELLSLMWLAFFILEGGQPFVPAKLELIEHVLPKMYRKARSFDQIRDTLRRTMTRRMQRVPSTDLRRYHKITETGVASIIPVALAVFQRLKDGVNELLFGGGRVKSKPLRRAKQLPLHRHHRNSATTISRCSYDGEVKWHYSHLTTSFHLPTFM